MPLQTVEALAQFGVAGLMGALWLWERWLSRRRERQLDEAHKMICNHRESLKIICAMVRKNTQAVERFNQTQIQLVRLLEKVHDRNQCDAA